MVAFHHLDGDSAAASEQYRGLPLAAGGEAQGAMFHAATRHTAVVGAEINTLNLGVEERAEAGDFGHR
ncbi:MAG: hypothetical protein DWG83_00160 [Chloroflexi bacterium]|nr:hypothetical protein [Chloroflexota bacterium]MDA1240005.1 hypothetical protein [Chloroflexota bacterium]MQC18973.1 hypothetical protein [Chloroflexota bacterium]MQC48540.1 hypothetical protein [Chloroflexota bacterium]